MLDAMEDSVLAAVQIKQQTAQQDLQMPLSCNSTDFPFFATGHKKPVKCRGIVEVNKSGYPSPTAIGGM